MSFDDRSHKRIMAISVIHLAIIYLCHGLMMAMAAPIGYTEYAKGVIVLPNMVLSVKSLAQCAITCKNMLVCSAFSTKADVTSSSGAIDCSIALGDFTWVDDPNASLYLEDIGLNTNYTLLKDGRFYKFVTDSPIPISIPDAELRCNAEGGHLPVPYPKARRDAISAFTTLYGLLNADRYLGITFLNTSDMNGLWVTNDGATFRANSSDPTQAWNPGYPLGGSSPGANGVCVYERNGFWNNQPCDSAGLTTKILCRRGLRYERSPANGKYYKLHLTKVNRTLAEQTCASEGGRLANAYGSSNRAGIAGPRAGLNVYSTWTWVTRVNNSFFIAGTDAEVDGIWKMPDGSSFNVADKATDPDQIWYPGEPNSGTNAYGLLYAPGDYFADIGPNAVYKFLCEIVV